MINSCSVIIRKSLSQEPAVLGIRAAWAMFTNASIDVKIILLGDGIYSALGKNGYITKMYERFIEAEGTIYVTEEDMNARSITAVSLPRGITLISAAEVTSLISDSDSIMTF